MGPLGGAGLCGDSIGSVLSSTLSLSPHGRFHTMSIMIAVDILGCTGSTEERAALLHKTIQLAAELKSTMGNMFSFAAVMNALEMTQVRGRSLCPPHTPPPLVAQPLGTTGTTPQQRQRGGSREGTEPPPLSRQPSPAGMRLFFSVVGLFCFCAGLCS